MNYLPTSHHFPAPPSPLLDDHIGSESGVDLKNFDEVAFSPPKSETFPSDNSRKKGVAPERQCSFVDRRQLYMKKEYPPLIPLLARTENLPPHMPWVLKRCYTSDGRLVLRGERVKHHEYLRAHRENGRLTLQLIPLDDDVSDPFLPLADQSEGDEDIKLEMDDTDINIEDNGIGNDNDKGDANTDIRTITENDGCNDNDADKDEECGKDGLVEEDVIAKLSTMSMSMSMSSGNNGGSPVAGVGNKCLNINSMGRVNVGGGIFGMQVPALRPVHS